MRVLVLERDRPGRAPRTWPPGCWRRSARRASARSAARAGARVASALAWRSPPSSRRSRADRSAISSSAPCTSPSIATRPPSCAAGSSSCSRWARGPSGCARAACRELEPGLGSVAAGVHAPHEAAVDPRTLTAALAAALEAAGGRIEIAEVDGALLEGDRLAGVRTADGREHRARATVLAAGAWSAADWLPDRARPPIRPVKGQILTLRGPAAEPVCERIVVGERVYLVPRADGRLVVGATVEEQGFDTADHRRRRARAAARGLPGAARGRRARAGRDRRRPAPRHPRQPAADRTRARSTGSCSRPATSATGSCSRR